jgi:hypothetical protein
LGVFLGGNLILNALKVLSQIPNLDKSLLVPSGRTILLTTLLFLFSFVFIQNVEELWILTDPTRPRGRSQGYEGFIVGDSRDYEKSVKVIDKRELLNRLEAHLQRIELPPGIDCNPRGEPPWVDRIQVRSYLRRIQQVNPEVEEKDFEPWVNLTMYVYSLICEERHWLTKAILSMEIDPKLDYSGDDVRRHCDELLAFYQRATIGSAKMRPSVEVNEIFGFGIGEIDPYMESSIQGSLNQKAQKAAEPSWGMGTDGRSLASLLKTPSISAIISLPTQTNETEAIWYISDQVSPSVWRVTRNPPE